MNDVAADSPSIETTAPRVDLTSPVEVRPIRFFARPDAVAGAVGLIFAWRSFYPTLMPRTWLTQAVMTALSFAIGYAIGLLAGYLVRQFSDRWSKAAPESVQRAARYIVLGGAALVVVLAFVSWARWQNQQRDLVGLDRLNPILAAPMLVASAVLIVILGLLGRAIAKVVVRVHRFNRRHLPAPLVSPATILLVVVVGWYLIQDGAIRSFGNWANRAYGVVDDETSPGTVQPSAATVSGSPDSLAAWDTLGLQGRDFVSQATTDELIEEFTGAPGRAPIRVYAGLRTADSAQARADLVVDELERTGAFERAVLVVTTVTGTGWVDPYAARSIELMYAGDTAIAAIQYSYLPSWISSLFDGDKMQEAGSVLYDTIYDAWSLLPADERPKLVAFGQSLGSLGAEAAFAGVEMGTSIANMRLRSDGILFTGPTNDNTMWRQFTTGRDLGSPAWQPVIGEGRTVRFATGERDLGTVPTDWPYPRVLYVEHPSDPVTFWGMSWLYSTPWWMEQPRGVDVPQAGGWFPIVTWIQGVFDLMAGFSAPPGHGHDYSPDFPGAWSQVIPPEGWTDADIARLSAFLDANPPPKAS